jgi:Cu-Zn family superoxide dismutase
MTEQAVAVRRPRRRRRVAALAATGALVAGIGVVAGPGVGSAAETEQGFALLKSAQGFVAGRVVFYGTDSTVTRVEAHVYLPGSGGGASPTEVPGFHGFHVHANDDPANGEGCVADASQPRSTWFVSADGHLAETGSVHGSHIGDLPPLLLTPRGRGYGVTLTERFDVSEVVGRAVILHVGPDNLANVPVGTGPTQYTSNSPEATSLTARTGNAGDRLACGVILPR